MDIFSIHNNRSVFVTFFAGKGQKNAPKTNGRSFVFPGLKPGAIDIFLLWRNGIPSIQDFPKIGSFLTNMGVLPNKYFAPFSAVFSSLSSLHKAIQSTYSLPFFLKIYFETQSTFKYKKNEN
jgi:hypothetical protein